MNLLWLIKEFMLFRCGKDYWPLGIVLWILYGVLMFQGLKIIYLAYLLLKTLS